MHALSPLCAAATAVLVAAPLSGCAGAATSSSSSPTASVATAACSQPSGSPNAALAVALTAGDLPASAASFKQTADGLLGGTPGTDARVFASVDGTTRVEVDLAVDIDRNAAASDYTAYVSAADKQIAKVSFSTTPHIGSRANEFAGVDSMSRSSVSLAFVQCAVIGVVTMVSAHTAVDSKVVEAIAQSQVEKISAAGL